MTQMHTYLLVAVIAAVTAGIRFAPFLVFAGGKVPRFIQKLERALPCAIMGMLVVYCVKDVNVSDIGSIAPMAVSCVVTVFLHLWRRNTLLSIVCGTLCYMLLVQIVF